MENRDIYPEKWLREKVVKISNNVMVIDNTDKDILYMQSAHKNFENVVTYIRSGHHPFDEITYSLTVKDTDGNNHSLIADVKNNRPGNVQCVMRLFSDIATFDNIIGLTGFIGTQQLLSPVIENADEYDYDCIKQTGRYVRRINELVGYFTLTRRNNKVFRKVGVKKYSSYTTVAIGKPRTIRLRDISELQLSTYVEGGGSKPSHEFGVRGHVRHYKNGKEVFIKPYTKCKGRGKNSPQFYKVN